MFWKCFLHKIKQAIPFAKSKRTDITEAEIPVTPHLDVLPVMTPEDRFMERLNMTKLVIDVVIFNVLLWTAAVVIRFVINNLPEITDLIWTVWQESL